MTRATTVRRFAFGLGIGLATAGANLTFAVAQEPLAPPQPLANAENPPPIVFTPPATMGGDRPLPINLPSALQLAHVRAWDISIASQQLKVAGAQLQGANVMWLPNIVAGTEYVYHNGPLQATNGTLSDSTRSSLYAGMAPLALFAVTDAMFTPLAQRQVFRAQEANVQTATNDTLTAVAVAYFDAQEARADLASVQDVLSKIQGLVAKIDSLAPDLIPDVEKARVRAQQLNVQQIAETARRRWRVASAELARVTRMDPTSVLEPLEPPNLRITLIPPDRTVDELIPIALAYRPELTYTQARAQAAYQRVRQEKWRPFLPILMARGGGTQTPYPLAFGTFGGGPGGTLNNFGTRVDFDLQAIWEVRNLGFGNRALIREKQASYEIARQQEFRFRDFVAREVAQSHADLESAANRVDLAEQELRQALISANQNLAAVGQTKRVGGNINVLVIRPQEAVAAVQALASAHFDYYGTAADFNRAQFQLYRALGNPAQCLYGRDGLNGKPLLDVGVPISNR
jgi:outer membrane protein TolC